MSESAPRRVAVALLHAPVLAKDGSEMVSTVTNLDVHDISRTAKTYGLSDFFVVTPVQAQRELVERVCSHWTHGSSAARIPTRQRALALVRLAPTLDDAIEQLGGREAVEVWTTAARSTRPILSFAEARAKVHADDTRAVLLVLGTSWGLAPRVLEQADALLASIPSREPSGFNHLSVRAAAAIVCDRLLG